MTTWRHNELASDLAHHLRGTSDRLVWTDMQIGPSGSARPDVYTIPKSYSKFLPMTYEVKISVADFRRDVTAGKWQSYLDFSAGVIFAAPQGLLSKADVPDGCGLIVRTDGGWRNIKGPTLKHIPTLPHEAWMKLMIDGLKRQRVEMNIKQAPEWAAQRALETRYGKDVGRLFADCTHLEFNLKEKKQRLQAELTAVNTEISDVQRDRWARERKVLEEEKATVEKMWVDLCQSLGVAPNDRWAAREKVALIHSGQAAEDEVRRATDALLLAHRTLTRAIQKSSANSEQRVREWMEKMGEPLASEAAE